MNNRAYTGRIGLEGILLVLAPLPILFVVCEGNPWGLRIETLLAGGASLLLLASSVTLLRRPGIGKLLGILAVILGYISTLHFVLGSQSETLAVTVLFIAAFFAFFDFAPKITNNPSTAPSRSIRRSFWGSLVLIPFLLINMFLQTFDIRYAPWLVAISVLLSFVMYLHCALLFKSLWRVLMSLVLVFFLSTSLQAGLYSSSYFLGAIMVVMQLVLLPRQKEKFEPREQWWEVLLTHPARVLLTTFLILCFCGTLLLLIPVTHFDAQISAVDAAFTSVSAVCVTGLIVLDTPLDFTVAGQSVILLLIQLGGLGIMSITTVALHVMGRRMSLKQERLMTSMTDTPHKDLIKSLATILKYTFIVEFIGAVILTLLFYRYGDTVGYAVYRGLFTSVSAFCNAGFALQSDSLIPYQSQPLILHTVGLLIILGGIAPAVALIIPKWLAGKVIPIPARIALVTTVIMLVSGMLVVLIFEWNGFLEGLSIFDKIQNAWFQSVTLRTAGFNSVDISQCDSPTFLVMIIYMFIGGSPGGTAGGIKTTTVGILAITFWANIMNRRDVIVQNRRIDPTTVFRAVTIVISGIIIWLAGLLMLEVTQQLPARELVFEITSAIATVGLTIGATPHLDEIGKVIIIIAMFVGRIGPMTLFMLLSDDSSSGSSQCLDEKISLT